MYKGSRKPELLEELEFYTSSQPLKTKAVDTFLRNIGNQESCFSVSQPAVTESSTSALWKPQISPHIIDVLCANICPESGYSDSGFSRFFSALPGKCQDIAKV